MKICKNCNKEFSTYLMLDGKKKNLNRRKFCLECVPFGENSKLSYKERSEKQKLTKTKECCICGKDITKKKGSKCSACISRMRRKIRKQKAIEYLGGKCQGENCKWEGEMPTECLDFHHKDPSEKEFAISYLGNSKWSKIEKELDKCELLCSNCHRMEHSKINEEKYEEKLKNYKSSI